MSLNKVETESCTSEIILMFFNLCMQRERERDEKESLKINLIGLFIGIQHFLLVNLLLPVTNIPECPCLLHGLSTISANDLSLAEVSLSVVRN